MAKTTKKVQEQGELFRVGPFVVSVDGLRVNGTPPAEQWAVALARIAWAKTGVQWAIGDMLLYGEKRGYDENLYESASEATGLQRGTLMNLKSVSKTFPPEKRVDGLSWSHHALVLGFEEEERLALLGDAMRRGLSWEAMRTEVRQRRRDHRRTAQEWPVGTFGLILADPPWQHELNALPPDRATENHYPTMSDDEIMALAPKVQGVTAPNAVLYLWATSAKVVSGTAARVLQAWGFEGKAMHVWVKDLQGLGYWVRNRHEHLLIATRGEPMTPDEDVRPDSVITSARGEHSAKPVEAYEVVERCYPGVPRLELFARDLRHGWVQWGNEELYEPAAAVRAVRLSEDAHAEARVR